MYLAIAAFIVPLAFDTLALAIMLGLRNVRPLRPALTFSLFEAVMPLIGLILGRIVGQRFATPAVLVGGIVLIGVAMHLLIAARKQYPEGDHLSFTTLRATVLAGLGISTDELAIGFPMGTSGLPVAETLGAIAVQTFLVTYLGIAAGKWLGNTGGRRVSRYAGVMGAVAFGLLGVYLIAQRLVPELPEI